MGTLAGWSLTWLLTREGFNALITKNFDSAESVATGVDLRPPTARETDTEPTESGSLDTGAPNYSDVASIYGPRIDAIARRGSFVKPGELQADLREALRLIRELPLSAAESALAAYLTGALNASAFEEVVDLAVSPEDLLATELKGFRLSDGGSALDDLHQRCIVLALNLGKIDQLAMAAEQAWSQNAEGARDVAAALGARILMSQGIASAVEKIPDLEHDYQKALQTNLLNLYAESHRMGGFIYLLESRDTIAVEPETIEKLIDESWFIEHANELSQKINESPPSRQRDLVIARMIQIIGKGDPGAASAWIAEISDEFLRKSVAQSFAIE